MIKQVPKTVNRRISRLSSDKKIFHESSKIQMTLCHIWPDGRLDKSFDNMVCLEVNLIQQDFR